VLVLESDLFHQIPLADEEVMRQATGWDQCFQFQLADRKEIWLAQTAGTTCSETFSSGTGEGKT